MAALIWMASTSARIIINCTYLEDAFTSRFLSTAGFSKTGSHPPLPLVGVLPVVHLVGAGCHEGMERLDAVGRLQADAQLAEQADRQHSLTGQQ
ncbi:MAG: hypothetical protein HW377_1011 [Actinobacteria bacterium]|nr:hypothetical protein [Actinomycetota bacterium]